MISRSFDAFSSKIFAPTFFFLHMFALITSFHHYHQLFEKTTAKKNSPSPPNLLTLVLRTKLLAIYAKKWEIEKHEERQRFGNSGYIISKWSKMYCYVISKQFALFWKSNGYGTSK